MSDKLDKLLGGRYLVTKSLRQTHLCETFVAQDTHLPGNPLCVVKQLKPQSTEEFVLNTAKRLFDNEANVLYRLGSHPQIPRLLAHLQVEEQFFLVQEFIKGQDLSHEEISPEKPQKWSEEKTKSFLTEVLGILSFVHNKNVIHRDIKPSNLIRREDGKIVLIDFGAVKEITNMTVTEGQTNVDRTVVVGTPGYMPREQHLGKPRFNSDIYALGMTVIHALTGFHPDQLPRDDETEAIIWRDRAPQCSPALANIIDKMVRPNSQRQRYQNANEVLRALEDPQETLIDETLRSSSNSSDIPVNKQQRPGEISSTVPSLGVSLTEEPKKFNWKKWLGIAAIPVVIGGIYLSPRIWRAFKAINYYTEGNALIQEEKYLEAIAAYNNAIRIQPTFTQAWTNKGFAQGKLGKALDKFASCSQAANVAPDFAEAWNCKGLAKFDLKKYEEALIEYDKAIEVDPNFHRAWFNKGQVYLKLRQYEEAIAATQKVLSIEPNYSLAWTQACQAQYLLGRYQDAQANCQESLQINENHQPTINLLEKVKSKLQ